ncbi:tenascin-R [Leucoraja erinacea]|uniref:tenascin-R n=1 Tax=Leucoraja erinaceus TaxID=7782 RepID=UPI0024538BF3|nr:tenascin-R [Leucoraja erinacea]
MMLLFNILAVCLSIFMDRGEHQVLVNAQRQKGDGTSASVHQINHTVLLQQQSIIFNHIYNINVPLVSLCSVRAESALGRAEPSPQEYAAEYFEQAQTMESQVGFTHNINIPQQACGCLRSSLLKNLMDRIELLEREVSMLRQECTSGYSAASLAAGQVDYAPMCSGHGNFSMETCDCSCDLGWTGKGCSELLCSSNCSGHGTCINGQCVCDPGYLGQDCNDTGCPNDCSGHGRCVQEECVCEETYKGEDCNQLKCPNACSGNGQCVNDSCLCSTAYTGEDCNQLRCLNNCSDNGQCNGGACSCLDGYTGQDCATVAPPKYLQTTDVTDRTVDLQWEGSSEVAEYFITYHPISPDWVQRELHVPVNRTTATIQGLEPGLEYVINVHAVKDQQLSEPISSHLTTHLSTPQGLRFQSVTESVVEVQWDPFQFAFDAWEISFIAKSNEGGMIVQLPTMVTCFNQTGLRPGEDYTVNLVALKEQMRSLPATATVSTLIDGPTRITIREVADTFAFVEWMPPKAYIDHILLSYGLTSGTHNMSMLRLQPTLTQYSLQNLRPGTQYQVSVTGVQEHRQSQPAIAVFTTEIDAPKNLRVVAQGFSKLDLEWDTSQADIDKYRVVYSTLAGGQYHEMIVPKSTGPSSKITLTDLLPSTEYGIGISAVKETKQSVPITMNTRTALDPPQDISFSNISPDSVTITWRKPSAAFDHYQMFYHPVSDHWDGMESVNISSLQNEYTLNKLLPATEYAVKLSTVQGLAESPLTSSTVQTAMDSPFDVQVANVTPTEVQLMWAAPQAAVQNYVIIVSRSQDVADKILIDGSVTQHRLINLQPFTNYSVTVYATRGSMTSSSVSLRFFTPLDSPKYLTASEVSQKSARISWQAPLAEIEKYVLLYKDSIGQQKELILEAEDTWIQLESLSEATEYTLRLQSAHDTVKSLPVEIVFTTASSLYPYPWDCTQHLLNGDTISGIYTIYTNGRPHLAVQVFCDMVTDNGGWTVFQRRRNGLTDFSRTWAEYRMGFGNLEDEFWLGLDNIHKISAQARYDLRIDLRDGRESVYAVYDRFYLSDARNLYKLRIGDYRGTAGDSLSYHQGRPFSTKDRDNDVAITNCALSYKGAWWYKNCHRANLNGKYGENRHSQGINWYHWKGHEISIPFIEMKIRPHSFEVI